MISDIEFCEKYLEILSVEFSGLNLTRITEFQEFHEKQFIDSIYPFREFSEVKNLVDKASFLIDVGFGGGFPLLPLANEFSEKTVIGFEARGKKSNAVNLIAERMGLKNINAFHRRFEDIFIDKPSLITFKAVSTIKNCLDLVNCGQGSFIGIYKAANVYELEGENLGVPADWKLKFSYSFQLGENKRYFFVFEKQNVPRGTNSKRKKLVNLSDVL